MAVGEVLEQYDTGPGIGQRFAPRVIVSETDPGAIGAGNIWLLVYADPIEIGTTRYQLNIRNAVDTGWMRPELFHVVDGTLRWRITLDYTDGTVGGGDIEVRDASSNTLLLIAWDETGDLDITNQDATLTWVNHVRMVATGVTISRGEAHSMTVDDDGVSFSSSGGQVRLIGAPTADPVVPYALWTDAGVVKMSAP